jgi:hypothetical protein
MLRARSLLNLTYVNRRTIWSCTAVASSSRAMVGLTRDVDPVVYRIHSDTQRYGGSEAVHAHAREVDASPPPCSRYRCLSFPQPSEWVPPSTLCSRYWCLPVLSILVPPPALTLDIGASLYPMLLTLVPPLPMLSTLVPPSHPAARGRCLYLRDE